MKKVNWFVVMLFILIVSIDAQTAGELDVSVQTSDAGGNYKQKNIVAIWIENEAGNFIKTLLAYADRRMTHLNTWQASTVAASSEFNVVDAITGATRSSHDVITCNWDGTDHNRVDVHDGIYKVWMELTDKNSTGNVSSFSFTKGEVADTLTPANVPSFSSIAIHWTPVSTFIDPGTAMGDQPLVYPNPGPGIFYVKNVRMEDIEVRNIAGQLIGFTYGDKGAIDISSQPEGIYIASIRVRNRLFHIRIIKRQ